LSARIENNKQAVYPQPQQANAQQNPTQSSQPKHYDHSHKRQDLRTSQKKTQGARPIDNLRTSVLGAPQSSNGGTTKKESTTLGARKGFVNKFESGGTPSIGFKSKQVSKEIAATGAEDNGQNRRGQKSRLYGPRQHIGPKHKKGRFDGDLYQGNDKQGKRGPLDQNVKKGHIGGPDKNIVVPPIKEVLAVPIKNIPLS
jgi:hypothetical protein